MRSMALAVCGLIVGLAAAAVAAEPVVKSGPQPGKADKPTYLPGSFHPYNVTGDRKGKYHCLVCRHGLSPAVAVFARQPPGQPDQPLAQLLKKLDEAVQNNQDARVGSFAVFLTDATDADRTAVIAELDKLNKALGLTQVVLSIDKAAGPDKYDLNKDADVTVLVYKDFEVIANFAFASADKMTKEDIDAILAAVEKMVAPLRRKPNTQPAVGEK